MARKKGPVERQKFISPENLAARWGLGRATIYRWVKAGKVKSIKGLGPVLIPLDWVERKEKEAGLETRPA